MFGNRYLHRIAVSLAAFAILFATLAPSISHALSAPADADSGWTEICTALGIKLVEAGPGEAAHAPADNADLHFEHCPFCQPQAHAVLLPPDSKPVLAPYGMRRVPRLFHHAPDTLHAWASAQPRAPPVFS